MGMELAVVGGMAAAGALSSATSKKSQTSTSTSQPWSVQQPHLQQAFTDAQSNYEAAKGRDAWEATNPTTAGLNDTQREAAAVAADYARGQGATNAALASQQAGALMGAGTGFLNNAGALAQNGAGPADATAAGVLTRAANGQAMGSAGVAGASGLAGQQGALATAQGLAAQGQTDLNPGIAAAAQGYMNSDLINGQVDAATRDVARTLGEETLPGLNAHAMAGGNLNSARAGAAEAVARRGAEDRAADISTAIRSDAFKTGINAALTANGQQNSLALGALSQAGSISGAMSNLGETQRQFDTSTRVNAAQSLGALDTSNRSLDAQTRLNANAQLGTATGMGFDAAQTAGALVDANAGRIGAQGDMQQAEEQRLIDQARTQYYANEERQKQALQDYYGIIGAQNWGNSTTSTVPTGAGNVFQGALGGAVGGLGMSASAGLLDKYASSAKAGSGAQGALFTGSNKFGS